MKSVLRFRRLLMVGLGLVMVLVMIIRKNRKACSALKAMVHEEDFIMTPEDGSVDEAVNRYLDWCTLQIELLNRGEQFRTPPKFVTVERASGLGNTLLAYSSVVALSMAMNRIVVFDWQPNDPLQCQMTDLFAPKFNLLMESLDPKVTEQRSWNTAPLISLTQHNPVDCYARLLLASDGPLHELEDFEVIRVQSNQFFAPLLWANPVAARRLRHRWGVPLSWNGPRELCESLHRSIFVPKPSIERRALQLGSAVRNGLDVPDFVGVHLRAFFERNLDVIAACASHQNATVFISADGRKELEDLKQRTQAVSGRPVFDSSLVETNEHEQRTNPFNNSNSCDQVKLALVDMIVLSRASTLILSRTSTFSTLAWAWSRPETRLLMASNCLQPQPYVLQMHVGLSGIRRAIEICDGTQASASLNELLSSTLDGFPGISLYNLTASLLSCAAARESLAPCKVIKRSG